MEMLIGIIYFINIMLDKEYGIGGYIFEEFDDVVCKGVWKDGFMFYLVMLYFLFVWISEVDMCVMYVYFMYGVELVNVVNKDIDILWLLLMCWLLVFWCGIFVLMLSDFVVNLQVDLVFECGCYLVEGLGYCGVCYILCSLMMQEKVFSESEGDDYLVGSNVLIDGWVVFSLCGENCDGLGIWSEVELVEFFKIGCNDKLVVFGGMSDVVEYSLQYFFDDDIIVIVCYLKLFLLCGGKQILVLVEDSVVKDLWKGNDSKIGVVLYVDNCVVCYCIDGVGYKCVFLLLKGNLVVQIEDVILFIYIVLIGSIMLVVKDVVFNLIMLLFGWCLDDQQVVDVVNFICISWGNNVLVVSVSDVVKVCKEIVVYDEKVLGNVDILKLLGVGQ